MHKGDRISGIVGVVLSSFVAIESFRLGLGNFHSPQAGFLPFMASVILGVLSLFLIVSVRGRKLNKEEITFNKPRMAKVAYLTGALFIYAILLNTLGFFFDTMLLMAFSLGIVEPQKWYVVIIGVISIPMISYLIFAVALQLQLPVGFLGF